MSHRSSNPRRVHLAGRRIPAVFVAFGVLISVAGRRPAPAEDTPQEALTPCEKHYGEIRKAIAAVPRDFRTVSSERAQEIAARVENASARCETFLRECADSPKVPEVHFFQAKFLYLLNRRVLEDRIRQLRETAGSSFPRSELERVMRSYYDRVADHARRASDGLPGDSPLRADSLQVLGWAYGRAGRNAEARDTYLEFLDSFRRDPDTALVLASIGRVYIELGEYDSGITLLSKHLDSPNVYAGSHYPHIGESLWKLYVAKGDLDGLLKWSNFVLTQYPLRLKGDSLKGYVRDDFQRILDFSGFRKGLALMALGKTQSAREVFQNHIDQLTKREAELTKQGRGLRPESDIYRQRSRTTLVFLDELGAKPAPMDFDLQEYWASERRAGVAASAGKVLAVVFRGVGDERSAGFIEKVDDFCLKEPKIDLLTVCYLRSDDYAMQVAQLQEELDRLGYESAAGFDPDRGGKTLFRTYKANVGSATFIVINTRGEPVYFQQDPRDLHAALARSILLRCMDE